MLSCTPENFSLSCFYQLSARSAPGWFYSYFGIFCLSVCLCVCDSHGRPGIELMVAAVAAICAVLAMCGCFELRSWFVRLLTAKGSQAILVISTVEARTALLPRAQYLTENGMPRNQQLIMNPEPRSETAGVTALCVT